MLQQTQVATVSPYYKEWLRRFPNFTALVQASGNDVLHCWQGLGYYARARNLHHAAKLIMERHRGRFPRAIAAMQQLPGIGKYTAHAVATFAFDQAVPVVEANTARVLSRIFNLRLPIDSTSGKDALWHYAASLIPKSQPAIYNSALLDLGALVCRPRKPKCGICPVRKFCRAKRPESLPIKRPRRPQKRLVERHAFIKSNGKLLLQRSACRWRGMWVLPRLSASSGNECAIYQAAFPFTNRRITLQIFPRRSLNCQNRQQRFFSKRELEHIPIPSPHRRAIEQLFVVA
jgi:A/G-specific adenine glycosylase